MLAFDSLTVQDMIMAVGMILAFSGGVKAGLLS